MIFRILNIHEIKDNAIDLIKQKYPKRYAKAQHFSKNEDFLRCLGGYILLTNLIGDFNEEDVTYNENEKPSISGKPFFNISHSGDYVIVAVNEKEVGVDIQLINGNAVKLATKVLTKEELDWMNADLINRFHILWAQKESVVKLIGTGLTTPFNSFNVLPFENEEDINFNGIQINNYSFVFENEYIVSISQKI